jgi:non-canonical purine NTP pyrophosphatase (RdgB/HAM1 family)
VLSVPRILVIASGNPAKVAEMAAMLDPLPMQVQQQPEGLVIEETGSSYAENARLKATTVATLCHSWTLADDSGLEVDALGGAPGIFSARYAASDRERITRLLVELNGSLYRSASFHSAVALADPDGIVRLEASGICRGEILTSPMGHGAGYDSLFWVRGSGCSYAQLPAHLKRQLGSRGKAVRSIAKAMLELLGLPPQP